MRIWRSEKTKNVLKVLRAEFFVLSVLITLAGKTAILWRERNVFPASASGRVNRREGRRGSFLSVVSVPPIVEWERWQ